MADGIACLFFDFSLRIFLHTDECYLQGTNIHQSRGKLEHELSHGWSEVSNQYKLGRLVLVLDDGDNIDTVDLELLVLSCRAEHHLVVVQSPTANFIVHELDSEPLRAVDIAPFENSAGLRLLMHSIFNSRNPSQCFQLLVNDILAVLCLAVLQVIRQDEPEEAPDSQFRPILFQEVHSALHGLQSQEVAQTNFVASSDYHIGEVLHK